MVRQTCEALPQEAESRKGRRQLIQLVCSSIHKNLGLQPDSVQNQEEHVHALWESFVVRQKREDLPGAQKALENLWKCLLGTQQDWQEKVWQPLCGALSSRPARARSQDKASLRRLPLRDVCLFLLLWGELGNLRFCPELLCFLFSAARAHMEWNESGVAQSPETDVEEGTFLRTVVKPLYVAVASETFNLQARGPPKFKWPGAPAPAMASNYDDWNELFWDPHRLASVIVFKSSSSHYNQRVPRRSSLSHTTDVGATEIWGVLPEVDWTKTLHQRKSHKELHSLLPFMVGNYRVFMVHTTLLALLMLTWSKDPRMGSWPQRAFIGVIPPLFVWFHMIGFHNLTPGIPFAYRVTDFLHLVCLYSLPLLTFALIVLQEFHSTPILPSPILPYAGKQPIWLLSIHFGISIFVFTCAVAPRPQNAYNWKFYPQQKEQDSWALVAFWAVTAGMKFLVDWLMAGQVDEVVLALWNLDWGDTLQQPDPARKKLSLLIVHHVVLAVPVGLASFATMSFFYNFAIGVVGAARGIHHFGGCELCCTLRGRGMTPVPEKTASRLLQLPPETGRRSSANWINFGNFWWNRMTDSELRAFVHVWNMMIQDLRDQDFVCDEEMRMLRIPNAEDARQGPPHIPPILDPLSMVVPRRVLPKNKEAKRRIITFARSVQMRGIPLGTVRDMPSVTILIPHYSETILYNREELFPDGTSSEVLRFLIKYYSDEFRNFVMRVGAPGALGGITARTVHSFTGERSARISGLEKELCKWASLRMQTLFRTVRGICHAYETALSTLLNLQEQGRLTQEECDELLKDRLQVVVAMQLYSHFTDITSPKFDVHKTAAAEALLQTFPRFLNIAFIDEEQTDEGTKYYSCLIDATCTSVERSTIGRESTVAASQRRSSTVVPPAARKARLRVELPGPPVLGHGKSDNQNCAIIFTRGEIMQMIDCNQDAYLESALFLPLALSEFNETRSDGLRPAILGFREHIFSDIGLLGKWAADNEFAFGTVVQRTMDWPLQARLHYGHPDMMDKLQMIQQGGVSKGTRGLNLSEDVFAGLDTTLRGGWTKYREYFHVGKGRDMGFMSILSFFGKVSQGNGEQATTRQWMRLALELPLLRYASIFYLHTGWYFNQCLINRALKGAAFMAAFFTLSETVSPTIGKAGASLISAYYGIYYLFYVLATMLPLTCEVFIERGCFAAFKGFWASLFSMSPIFASFQSKLMDYHFLTTLTYGGAQYIPTGRGLATCRESFLTIFRSFATSHMDDALEIAMFLVFSNGQNYGELFYLCAGVTVTSWILCPFLFNPWQFDASTAGVFKDLQDWRNWLHSADDKPELAWWAWAAGQQNIKRSRSRRWMVVPSIRLLTVACTLVLCRAVLPFPDLPTTSTFARYTTWFRAMLCYLPPFFHVVPCIVFAGLYRSDHGKSLYVLLAIAAVASTLVELLLMDHPKLHWGTLNVVLFHKYMALRLFLEVSDDLCGRQCGGIALSALHNICRMWSLSWRFLRDAFLGYLLIMVWLLLSFIIPNSCHTAFLFSTRRLDPETRARQEGASAASEEDVSPDDLVRQFFNHFAQDGDDLMRLLDGGGAQPSNQSIPSMSVSVTDQQALDTQLLANES